MVLLRVTRWLVLRVGRRFARLLLWPITAYFYVRLGDGRVALTDYYERLGGPKPRARLLFHHYLTFAHTILDRVYLLAGHRDAPRCDIHGFEAVRAYLRQGRGCILLGAHLGSFEAARAIALDHPELKMQVIMRTDISPKLNDTLAVLHPGALDTIVSLGSPGALLGVKEALDQGGLVGFMGDRVVPGEAAYEAAFLGSEALFPLGPLRLAASLRAPVFFFVALYRTSIEGTPYYEVVFEPLCEPAPTGHERTPWVRDLGERYTATIQRYCRGAPDNWFNFYDFWRAPLGGSPTAVRVRPERTGSDPVLDLVETPARARSHGKS